MALKEHSYSVSFPASSEGIWSNVRKLLNERKTLQKYKIYVLFVKYVIQIWSLVSKHRGDPHPEYYTKKFGQVWKLIKMSLVY